MKLVAITRVLNEEDIIEPLIRHHAALVDHHIVLDNGSVDRTLDILTALYREGAAITILSNPSVIFSETQFNTMLYALAVGHFGADWVVYLDADEFVDARPIGDLRAFLANVAEHHASVGVQLINYDAPTPASQHDINVVKRLCRRLPAPIDAWKVFVRGAIRGRVAVDAGNHHIFIDGAYQPPLRQSDFRLAHFPSRSPLHWAGKAVTGRFKVLAAGQTELRQKRATHYNDLVETLKRSPGAWVRQALADTERPQSGGELVTDPIDYLGDSLKFTATPDYGWRALSLLLANYEQLATAHGTLLDAVPQVRARVDADLQAVRLLAGDDTLSPIFNGSRLPAPALVARPPDLRYVCASLDELAAERIDWLPPASYDVPDPWFGDRLERPDLEFHPTGDRGAGRIDRAAVPAFLLREALLHGSEGVITVGNRAVTESVAQVAALAAGDWRRTGVLTLPQRPLTTTVYTGYHLMPGEPGNYYHWMIDAIARFDPERYGALAGHGQSQSVPQLLLPTLDVFWKWESVGLLVPGGVPRVALAAASEAFVQRLLYVPDLSGGIFRPHPALLRAFDAMRQTVLGGAPAQPWRRLYISRADSRNRVLANEAEVIARAERAGFTAVVLSTLSVPDQVRLFAEASHILAPHGAGLVNIGFCHPGTVLCELHMDSYVHWAFRRLAAVRGIRYGCLVGTTEGARATVPHQNSWRLDPRDLDAVLADRRFTG